MFELTDEQKNDELVKSLLDSGFSEDVVAGWIKSGAVTIEKSTQYGPDDHGEGDGDDDDEKRADKGTKKRKKEDDEEGKAEDAEDAREKDFKKGKHCDGDDKEQLAKSLGIDDLMKSLSNDILGQVDDKNEEFLKSIPAAIERAFEPILDKIEKSLDGMRQAIVAFGDKAPSFKGADLNKALIQKSIENGGGAKDENGKMALSVTRDRAVVRELILKSIEEEADPEIQKSLRMNTTAYVMDPVEGAIGEPAAKYFFEKKGVRLVK